MVPQPAIGLPDKSLGDGLQNAFPLPHYLLISEAENSETSLARQFGIPKPVRFGVMGLSINLDHQMLRRTEEINNSVADYGLAAELVAGELAGLDCLPKQVFGLRWIVSHLACTGEKLRASATTPNPLL